MGENLITLLCNANAGVNLTLSHNGSEEIVPIDGSKNVSVTKIGYDDGDGLFCTYESTTTSKRLSLKWYLDDTPIPRRSSDSSQLGWISLFHRDRKTLKATLKRNKNRAASEGVFFCNFTRPHNPPSASVALYYPSEYIYYGVLCSTKLKYCSPLQC